MGGAGIGPDEGAAASWELRCLIFTTEDGGRLAGLGRAPPLGEQSRATVHLGGRHWLILLVPTVNIYTQTRETCHSPVSEASASLTQPCLCQQNTLTQESHVVHTSPAFFFLNCS